MSTSDVPPVFQLFTEIGIIEQLARNRLEGNLPYGLTASQFNVLNHLVRLDGVWSPSRLANAFQVTKGAMTNTLKRLEKRDFILIVADPEDARGKCVTLTQTGLDARAECLRELTPLFAEMSKEISIEDMTVVLPTLEKIRKYLDDQRA